METRIHLFINHLPLFGAALGLITLLLGMGWKNKQTVQAAFILLLLASLSAVVAYITGEGAEETVEHLPGISEVTIEDHEEAGKFALFAFIPLGVASLAGLLFSKPKWTKWLPAGAGVLAVSGIAVALWIGNLGGKIRHTELNETPTVAVTREPAKEAIAPNLIKDNGKRWKANPETTRAISNMLNQTEALPSNPSEEEFSALQESLQFEYKELVRQCTMTGPAHDQLHNYILPLREKIDELDDEPSEESITELLRYLNAYFEYFE